MKAIILSILLIPLIIFANDIKEKTEDVIHEQFGNNVEIKFSKYEIPDIIKDEIEYKIKQKFFSKGVYVWKIKKEDRIIALGLMDNVYGKAQPITFLTIFLMEGKIHSNHIIKYREEHGGQVRNKVWNEQFVGMNDDSDFSHIDGISGATISVNSVKKGVQKLSLLINNILKEELK